MTDPTPAEALKALRNYGYAPGNYTCQCYTCDEQFDGVKDAKRCRKCATSAQAALSPPDAGEVRTYRDGVEDAARVCAEWSTMLSMRVDDLIRIRASQRTVKAIREAANQLLNAESAIRKLP